MEYNDSIVADDSKCEKMNSEYMHMYPESVAERIMGEMAAERERLHRLDEKKYAPWIHAYDKMMAMMDTMIGNDAISPMRSESEMGVHTTRHTRNRRYPLWSIFPIFRR